MVAEDLGAAGTLPGSGHNATISSAVADSNSRPPKSPSVTTRSPSRPSKFDPRIVRVSAKS
jgi:hypothetical protein